MKDPKHIKGQKGELLALRHLEKCNYSFLAQNYRFRRSEIDLIMRDCNTIVFVEVKYRKSNRYGFPEEFVSNNQKRSIIEAADEYLVTNNWEGSIRFDIVAINASLEIQHFEDAFY